MVDEQVAQVNSYCGVTTVALPVKTDTDNLEPKEEAKEESEPLRLDQDDGYEDDEYVLVGLDYESDNGFLDGDDEGGATSV